MDNIYEEKENYLKKIKIQKKIKKIFKNINQQF